MKKIILIFAAAFLWACSSDDKTSSTSEIVKSASDIMGNWRPVEFYRANSTENTLIPCEAELSQLFFGENHLLQKRKGITATDLTCHTSTSVYDEYYVLVGIVRLEQNSFNKEIYDAKLVGSKLHLKQTAYSNANGFFHIPIEDQVTYVYQKQ